MQGKLDQDLVMSVIWVAWVLAPAAALAPEIIKAVRAVVTSLRGVGAGRDPAAVTPSLDSAPTGPGRPKPAIRLLAARGIVPLHVRGRADYRQCPDAVRAA